MRFSVRRAAAVGLSGAALAMVAGAGWLAAYPFYTDLKANGHQSKLKQSFAASATKVAFETGKVAEGGALTRIIIPKLEVDTMVVEGTSLKALAAGAGHYRGTPLPGEIGNVAIAGHRTMNGKPFGNLDQMRPGDRIQLITPFARHTYEVIEGFDGHANPWVTAPNDWAVIAPSTNALLTLTTCHPRGSDKQRMAVRAKLVGSEPVS